MTIGGVQRAFSTYESNLLYVLRFMVDKKIVGGECSARSGRQLYVV